MNSPRLLQRSFLMVSLNHHFRSISTNSAINRGIRHSLAADRYYEQRENASDHREDELTSTGHHNPATANYPHIRRVVARRMGEVEGEEETGRNLSPRLDSEALEFDGYTPAPRRYIPKVNYDSEWIYGTSVVEAALRCKRRELYKLYVYAGENRTPTVRERDVGMKNLARAAGVQVVEENDIGMLDSMSNSRPHNGYVLECLPIQKTPISAFGDVLEDKTFFQLELAKHYPDGRPVTEHYPDKIHCRDPKRRHPFVLMLDEISDPGNMGAILRSAYFLGVDAVTLSARNCAPLSPVCLKSSAGAAELLPIFEHAKSERLITQSTDNGWTFYVAIPPPTKNQARRNRYVYASKVSEAVKTSPIVLLVGSEGEGVRPILKKLVQYCVSLDKGPGTDCLVDSLNVSVASALLCSKFLKA